MPARAPLDLHAMRDDYRRLGPAERRLWRWPMMWLSAAAVTAAPLAYAALALGGALDPYGHMDALPVALVNLDQGAADRGHTYTLGRDLVRDLTATPKFRYIPYASEEAAQDAVQRGDASFALTIPKTFSAHAAAGSSAQRGTLNVYVAEGSDYFASRVATAFSTDLVAGLNATLGETRWTIVRRTLAGVQQDLNTMRAATGQLTDAATQVKIGTRQLAYGAGTLAATARQAADSGQQLVTGATSLSGAVTRVSDGTGRVTRGLKTLEADTPDAAQLAPLKAAASRVTGDAGELVTGLGAVASGARTVAGRATAAAAGARQLAQDGTALATRLPALRTDVGQLAAGATRLAAAARTASAGATRLSASAQQLTATLPALQSRLNQLSGSAARLATSAADLDAGARPLTPSAPALAASLPALQSGLAQVNARARQFSISAGTFAQQLAGMNATLRTQFLVPQAIREDVAALAAQAERVRADSVLLRARLDQLGAPLRRATGTAGTAPVADPRTVPDPGTLAGPLSAARASATDAAQEAARLTAGAAPLAASVRAMSDRAGELAAQATAARSGAATAVQTAGDLARGATALAGNAQAVQVGAASVADGATRAAAGARTVQGDAKTVQTGVTALTDRTVTVRSTLGQLARQLPGQDDLNAVKGGARTLATRSRDLGQGLGTVASGATTLQQGASDVNAGAGQLLAGLTTLHATIPARLDALTGDPADLNVSVTPAVQTFAPVRNNGAALAPAVIALSLWLGVTLTTFIFPYQQLPRSGRRSSQVARVLRKATVPAALVTAQAVLVVLGVHALGVGLLHPAQTVLIAVVTGVTFLTLTLALVVCFGAAGRLLGVILLALQVAAAGGSFSVQTAPHVFQVIHAWLPVTPGAGALRHAMNGALEGQSSTFMLTLLAVFAAGCGAALFGRRRWEFVADEDFRPLISAPMTSRDVPPDPYIDAPTHRELPERAMHG